jgi:hypothetical protein
MASTCGNVSSVYASLALRPPGGGVADTVAYSPSLVGRLEGANRPLDAPKGSETMLANES